MTRLGIFYLAGIGSVCLVACGDEGDGPEPVEDTAVDVEEVTDPGPPAPRLVFVEIGDDPDAVAALDCDDTTTPGADIDAAVLFSDPSLTTTAATLSECAWAVPPDTCAANAFSEVSAAHGAPDASPGGGFVALNGGTLRCRWSDGAALTLGNVVSVVEISAENTTENHRVRACNDAEPSECGPWQTATKADETVPAGKLFF